MHTGTLIAASSLLVLVACSARQVPQLTRQIPFVTQQTSDVNRTVGDLLTIVDQRNPKIALQELTKRMRADPIIFKNCHGIAHDIGHEAYKKYQNFSVALHYQDTVCADGYLHGIIEQRFRFSTNVADILKEMKTICKGTGTQAGRCYHGVGHGLMFFFENDLPKSLSACHTYSGSGSARGRCYEGVFMENFLSDEILHPSKYLDNNNPLYPCPTEPAGLKPYCYFYAPIFYLTLHDNDYVSALKWCTTDVVGMSSCTRGVGSLAMKYNIDNPKYVEELCMQSPLKKQIPFCIGGMVSYYRTFTGNPRTVSQMCLRLKGGNRLLCNAPVQSGSITPMD